MSHTIQNVSNESLFLKNSNIIEFLTAIESDFELSKDQFVSIINVVPLSKSTNSIPYKLYKKKSSLLSVLRLW